MARSAKWIWGGLAAGLLATAAIGAVALDPQGRIETLLASAEEPEAAKPQRVSQPVRVTPIVWQNPVQDDTYTGTVRARYQSQMGFRVAGKITERLVDTGDLVTAGQPLLRLDDTDIRLDLEASQAEVDSATTDQTRASAAVSRAQSLFQDGFVAQAALDRANSDAAAAQSRLDRAVRARDAAANRLDYAVLVAETDGIVTATMGEPGQVVPAGQPVLTMARTDSPEVEIAMPEQKRDTLDQTTATATLWEDEGQPFALTLREVSPDVDPAARTYRVRFAIDLPDDRLALGRTVTVTLAAPEVAPVAAVPLAAILDDGHGPMVLMLDATGTRVTTVPVTIVSYDDTTALIRADLVAGEKVVSLGVHRIDPARPVRIVEETPAPAI